MKGKILTTVCMSLLAAGCYGAEVDASLDGVYACDLDSDCALGYACVLGVCRDQLSVEGPALEVTDPPELAVFPIGESQIPISVAGENLVLSDGDSDAASAGYIEVSLDGAVVDTITEGDLALGVTLSSVIAPETPGLHHITLSARRLDGEIFRGEGSVVSSAFWIDDGREQIGILQPAPGSRIDLDDPSIQVEIASLNFTFVNPGFISPDEAGAAREGYVHLYVNADVPTCIPACNFEHQSTVMPAGLSRVNRVMAERKIDLPEQIGTARIQVVAQDLLQQPYYRDTELTDLVFHQVPVQSVVGLE